MLIAHLGAPGLYHALCMVVLVCTGAALQGFLYKGIIDMHLGL